MKKVLIIPDSFKGNLSSIEVCEIIKKGISKVRDDLLIKCIPIADGGEGTVEALLFALGGSIKEVRVKSPMGEYVNARYAFTSDNKAIIEMSSSSGLPLIHGEKNPLIASTFGTGEIILDAIENGAREILLGLGGSATNDFGIGMAAAFGYRFLDASGSEVEPLAKNMIIIKDIDISNVHERLLNTHITAICDVSNMLYGDYGATAIYGTQKGVTDTTFQILDDGLKNMAYIVKAKLNKDVAYMESAGAAGGLGAGIMSFCNADIKSGINAILDIVNFEDEIKDTHLVITGEGAIDGQTKNGKVAIGIANRSNNVPVIAIVGDIRDGAEELYNMGILSIMPALKRAMPLDEAIKNATSLIEDAAERAMRFISISI